MNCFFRNCRNMLPNLSLLRQIISELRYALPEGSLKDNLTLKYIISQFRKYKTTDEQLCKAKEEMESIARTYLCYLKSLRLEKQILDQYHGKGERTVSETAKMVGFKLPHDPK